MVRLCLPYRRKAAFLDKIQGSGTFPCNYLKKSMTLEEQLELYQRFCNGDDDALAKFGVVNPCAGGEGGGRFFPAMRCGFKRRGGHGSQWLRAAGRCAKQDEYPRLNLCPKAEPKPASTEIETAIKSAFERNALVDANKIQVETEGSKVTLRGKVRSYAEREEAERAVWAAPGVVSVDNQLTVKWSLLAG